MGPLFRPVGGVAGVKTLAGFAFVGRSGVFNVLSGSALPSGVGWGWDGVGCGGRVVLFYYTRFKVANQDPEVNIVKRKVEIWWRFGGGLVKILP